MNFKMNGKIVGFIEDKFAIRQQDEIRLLTRYGLKDLSNLLDKDVVVDCWITPDGTVWPRDINQAPPQK